MVDFDMRPAPPQSTHRAPPRRAVFRSKSEQALARIADATTPKRSGSSQPSALLRAILKHPNRVRFPKEGAAAWPLDQFTQRRLKDGDIRLASDQRR